MVLPCKHEQNVVDQVEPTIGLLSNLDSSHPEVLREHAINPDDYKAGLVFRSAIESIRGSFIASSTTGREGFVNDILENLFQRSLIKKYTHNSSRQRYDFAVLIDEKPEYFMAMEVKGGEGNSINISERPLWAKEFAVWCHLDGAIVNQPSHGAHSILNRITNELVRRQKRVDALFFKDILCGTYARPCPKYPNQATSIGLKTAPDIFLFPRMIPTLEVPKSPIHSLQDLKLPTLILDLFDIEDSSKGNHIWEVYTKPHDIVLDPFSGSGVVPFEAALNNRQAWANDLSLYAYVLTRGKLEAPKTKQIALEKAHVVLKEVEQEAQHTDITHVPKWVKEFFHPDTLKEVIIAFSIFRKQEDYFSLSCLLGILHHVRPGFLSYPASHLVPYLRKSKYPPEQFPEMYQYRDLRSRLIAKIRRAYRRQLLPQDWDKKSYKVFMANSMSLPIENESVHAIISSPPYFGALDYARDNRLRLWFLGVKDWKDLDASLTASSKVYLPQMENCLKEMYRVLKTGSPCVLVLGDVERNGKTRNTAQILSELALKVSDNKFAIDSIYDDIIPDNRRSRRKTKTTKIERILTMYKR